MTHPADLSDSDIDRIVGDLRSRLHYAGVAGTGMSALAHYRAQQGGSVSGSDRDFDRGRLGEDRALAVAAGIRIFPQDGSGVAGASLVIASTAVESSIPDIARAREAGVPVIHRAALLAAHVRARPAIAVAGTSGKSTVVAMIFEALRGAGRDPGLITGGELRVFRDTGRCGRAYAGRDWLVIEADESDKSLVHYEPAIGVLLNLQLDHDDPASFVPVFETFRRRTRQHFVVGDDENLADFRACSLVFGFGPHAALRGKDLELRPDGGSFDFQGRCVRLPVPGQHNIFNALAALAACSAAGVPPEGAIRGLENFRGVARRFESLGDHDGVEVIDDFAHNPTKMAAALRTAQRRAARVIAVFQPHGFAPMRLMRRELGDMLLETLRPEDELRLLEIFFPGGSAVRDLSSADLCSEFRARGIRVTFAPDRAQLIAEVANEARAGDLVLSMGARDASLAEVAHGIAAALDARPGRRHHPQTIRSQQTP